MDAGFQANPSMRTLLAAALFLASWATPSHAQTLFAEDFESGYANWAMTGLWNPQEVSEPCTTFAVPFPSGTHAAWCGRASTCDFSGTGGALGPVGILTLLQPIALPSTTGVIELNFLTMSQAEDEEDLDARFVQVSTNGGVSWVTVLECHNAFLPWRLRVADLTSYAGSSIRVRFAFYSLDGVANDGFGWLLDDIEIVVRDASAIPHCLGDATGMGCPCNNVGALGRGCASSFNPAGAQLSASGFASVSTDSLVFAADGMSTAAATIVQSSGYAQYPWTSTFAGDGRVCVAAPLTRIRTVAAPGGAATYPLAGDVPISIRGNVPAIGGTRYYFVRYRNALSFCTPAPFNVTNGLIVAWRP